MVAGVPSASVGSWVLTQQTQGFGRNCSVPEFTGSQVRLPGLRSHVRPFFHFHRHGLPSLKTKTHKSAPGKYDFFFTLHKAVKKPRIASFAFNLQKLSHNSSPAQNLVANQLYFLAQDTVELLLEKRAWTSDGACGRTRDSGFCNDDLRVRAEWGGGGKKHRKILPISMRESLCVLTNTVSCI